jgi:Cupin-like domain
MEYSPSQTLELPRVSSITPSELQTRYIDRGIPVVINGMIDDWPAMKWNLDSFRDAAGDVEVPVRGNRYNFRLLGTTRLSEYLRWLEGGAPTDFLDAIKHTAPYISHNRGITPFMEKDVDFTRFAPAGYRLGKPAFWLGPPCAETPLHYDSVGIVFFAQVLGRKQVILFPKEQSRLLYESGYFEFTTRYSKVDLRDLDLALFPRLAEAKPYVTVLVPGDVLVFPRRLWHEFRTLDVSLSVTTHAGTRFDYSHCHPTLLRERVRQVLHWMGVYARGRCSCHSTLESTRWEECMGTVVSSSMAVPEWARKPRALSHLVLAISRRMLHSRSLGEIVALERANRQ